MRRKSFIMEEDTCGRKAVPCVRADNAQSSSFFEMRGAMTFLRLIRIKHWVKNGLVLFPYVFSGELVSDGGGRSLPFYRSV